MSTSNDGKSELDALETLIHKKATSQSASEHSGFFPSTPQSQLPSGSTVLQRGEDVQGLLTNLLPIPAPPKELFEPSAHLGAADWRKTSSNRNHGYLSGMCAVTVYWMSAAMYLAGQSSGFTLLSLYIAGTCHLVSSQAKLGWLIRRNDQPSKWKELYAEKVRAYEEKQKEAELKRWGSTPIPLQPKAESRSTSSASPNNSLPSSTNIEPLKPPEALHSSAASIAASKVRQNDPTVAPPPSASPAPRTSTPDDHLKDEGSALVASSPLELAKKQSADAANLKDNSKKSLVELYKEGIALTKQKQAEKEMLLAKLRAPTPESVHKQTAEPQVPLPSTAMTAGPVGVVAVIPRNPPGAFYYDVLGSSIWFLTAVQQFVIHRKVKWAGYCSWAGLMSCTYFTVRALGELEKSLES